MRLALVVPVLLAACAAPASESPYGWDEPVPEIEAEPIGGLSPDQLGQLRGLPFPALVPGEVGSFELARFETETDGTYGSYQLGYRRPDGACLTVLGGNEGLGSPGLPIVSTEARIADLGQPVAVYQAADDPAASSAEVWGTRAVVALIDLDRAGYRVLSQPGDGCRPVSLAEGAALVADLRVVSPSSAAPREPSAFGAFAPAPDLLDGTNQATAPVLAADALARRYEGAAERVTVEVLGETAREARALVTAYGLPDDSIRDERLLLTYARRGDQWVLSDAGRQVRCWPNRGHAEWSPDACL